MKIIIRLLLLLHSWRVYEHYLALPATTVRALRYIFLFKPLLKDKVAGSTAVIMNYDHG